MIKKQIFGFVAYICAGMYLQEAEVITHPAYWTLYGATIGAFITKKWRE